jgi:hypothetical protein
LPCVSPATSKAQPHAPGDKAPDPATLFSNEFVGRVTLTPDEWAKAEANVEPYRDFFT